MDSKSYTPGSRDILYKKTFLLISEMKYLEREIKKFNWLERTFLRKKEFYKMQYQKSKCDSNFFREGANKRGNSSRLTQSFHFFMFEPIFSPVNALNQPI